MTEFKKGDRVLVEGVVDKEWLGASPGCLWVEFADAGHSLPVHPSRMQLAPDQPLKEGDQVITLGGSLGFIRAIYKGEAYVILFDSPTRLSITCDLSHLRRVNTQPGGVTYVDPIDYFRRAHDAARNVDRKV